MSARDRLPSSSRAWGCPYFVSIMLICIATLIVSIQSEHVSVRMICVFALWLIAGIMIGMRRTGDRCDV